MTKEEYLKIINEEINSIINELSKNGRYNDYSNLLSTLNEEKVLLCEMADKSPNEIYDEIIKNHLKYVKGISVLVPGLSTGMKDINSDISLYTYSGETNGLKIDENTRFDLASTTKLFTALEALKLEEEGKFDLNKNVADYSEKYKNLQIPVNLMAKFYYDLETAGRIDDENISLKELERRLSNTRIVKDKTFIYSDIPFIILKDIMPKSDEYFKQYFNEEMKLLQTSYETFGTLTGSKFSNKGLTHDTKARIMHKYKLNPGHAGIFGTSKDLIKLFTSLYNGFLSEKSIKEMITPAINGAYLIDEKVIPINRGLAVYIKHPGGIRRCELTDILSDEAFAITGFTGTYAAFDLKNGISANILANPLLDENTKEVIIDNEKFIIKDCGKSFENGTKLKINGKMTTIENDTIPFTRITNTLKEEQFYTLIKLRLVKQVLKRKALINQSQILDDEVNKTLKKVVRL